MSDGTGMVDVYGQIIATGVVDKDGSRSPLMFREHWRYYAVIYLLAGEGWFESAPTDGRVVRAGDLLLLHPDVAHRYGPQPGQTWRELYVTFSGPVFDALFRTGVLTPAQAVLSLPLALWRGRFESFLSTDALSASSLSQRLEPVCRMQALLLELAGVSGGPAEPAWLRQARERLQEVTTLGLDLQLLARELGMSYETFRKQFRAWTGESPARHHTAQVMRRACAMLYAGDRRLKEIAQELGFCDEHHFSARFKQWTGQSPTHYTGRTGAPRG